MKPRLSVYIGMASLLAILPSSSALGQARRALKEGQQSYEKKDYPAAIESFGKAAESAAKEKLDPAVARFNEGNAIFKSGNPDEALLRYRDATRSSDLALQQKAFFNAGNALFALSDALSQQAQMEPAIKHLDEAMLMYQHAMGLDPEDEDPKVNYELAVLRREELEQQQQQKQDDQKQEEDQPQDQQDQKPQEEEKQDQQQQSRPEEQQPGQEEQRQPEKAEEMTQEEAQMLLDAMKEDEKSKREQLRVFMGQPVPVDKDW